jgi:hypothetical protein
MGWMDMVKGAVVSGVIVVVHAFVSTMEMVMGMFMLVLTALEMFALVGMDFLPVPVFRGVHMGVFVGMPVLVFMCAFPINTPFLDVNVG